MGMDVEKRAYFSGEKLSPDALQQELLSEPPGAVMINNAASPGLLIVQNFLPGEICKRIIQESASVEAKSGKVVSEGTDGAQTRKIVDSRKVEDFPASMLRTDVDFLVRTAFADFVSRHFRAPIEWYESPMILRYKKSGEYYAHADAYNWIDDQKVWRRVANRDYSLLIYLNEDFEGGQLEFKYLNYKISPMQGLLVAFPSDWRYAHAALPVAKGVKHTIVSFAAAEGTPRLDGPLPENLVRL